MPETPASGLPLDARTWRPMRPYQGRRTFEIVDPVVEPFWSGIRVLVEVAPAAAGRARHVSVSDDDGTDLVGEIAELAADIDRCVLAHDAVIDGVISRQIGLDGVGAAAIPELRDRPGLVRSRADLDVRARGPDQELVADDEGFVAVDLLRVDGQPLLDVPLLERKRLLESVVRPEGQVIVSVHARPPIESWVATWKSIGLRGGLLKAANSRYRPGEDTTEWRVVEQVARRHV